MSDKHYDAIVIGGGHNGLVAAGYLARNNLSVLVLERLDKLGGAVTTDEFSPGFLGPMCSYGVHLLQGKVIDDLRLKENGLEFVGQEVPRQSSSMWGGGFHPYPDGTFLGGPRHPRPPGPGQPDPGVL